MAHTAAIRALNVQLAPFRMVETSKSCSLLLTDLDYGDNLFATRAKDGFEGNGYDWQSVATVVLSKADPHLTKAVKFDSEASMFCAYGPFDDVAAFARIFKDTVEHPDRFVEALNAAELD